MQSIVLWHQDKSVCEAVRQTSNRDSTHNWNLKQIILLLKFQIFTYNNPTFVSRNFYCLWIDAWNSKTCKLINWRKSVKNVQYSFPIVEKLLTSVQSLVIVQWKHVSSQFLPHGDHSKWVTGFAVKYRYKGSFHVASP